MSRSALAFKVIRKAPELIAPVKPTPRELKLLSDIDDQQNLRFHIPMISFYRKSEAAQGKDPVKVIREALAQALVFYYPLAGRLRELGENRKLAVDCTGEGILFIEADADVSADDLGDVTQPLTSAFDELLFNVPGSRRLIGGPLLLIQVTRLACGGFVMAVRLNHTMCDAVGLVQFMTAVSELAKGLPTLSVHPVWQRQLVTARDPPRVTRVHREYDKVQDDTLPLEGLVHRSFCFSNKEVDLLRSFVPPHLKPYSTFELLAAVFWRTRTIALKFDPNKEIRLMSLVNARNKFSPPLPKGYYGNAIAFSTAFTTAGKLSASPIGFALELVQKAKNDVTEEYVRSMMDFLVLNNRPNVVLGGSFILSDLRRAGLEKIDYGWGKAIFQLEPNPGMATNLLLSKNEKGENGIRMPITLPAAAMEVFVEELRYLFEVGRLASRKQNNKTIPLITSSL